MGDTPEATSPTGVQSPSSTGGSGPGFGPRSSAAPPTRPIKLPDGPRFALDVECVATDTTHNGRTLAQIGLVDWHGNILLNIFVRPEVAVTSYL